MRFYVALFGAVLIAGCGEKKKDPEPASAPQEPKAAVEAKAATPPKKQDLAADASALLDKWVAAQTDGKLDAYLALYDDGFKGVRRTGGGAEKTLDLAGWKADREKLFKNKQKVAADDVKKKVDGDKVTLTFIQRWKGGKFADHGEKVLELEAKGGALKIVREELKWSERGWEDGKEKVFDATGMASPITVTVARANKPDNGDCSEASLRVTLADAKGKKESFDYGTITGMGGDAAQKAGKLTPKGGEWTDLGVYCAGLQQGYTIKQAGDTLVALAIWNDEESGPGKDSKVIAKLPAGAKVVAK